MAKFRKTQSNFSAGIIGPELRGRIDIGEYSQGCFEIENFYGNEQGGLNSRHGLNYIPLYYSGDEANKKELSEIIADCNKQVYFFDIDDKEWIGFVGLSENKLLYTNPTSPNYQSYQPAGAINIKTGEVVKFTREFVGTTIAVTSEIFFSNDPDYYSWNVKADLGDTNFLHTRVGSSFIITHTSGKYAPTYVKWDGDLKAFFVFSVVDHTMGSRLFGGLWSVARSYEVVINSAAFAQPEKAVNLNKDIKLKFIQKVGTGFQTNYEVSIVKDDNTVYTDTEMDLSIFRPENFGKMITVRVLDGANPYYHHFYIAGYYNTDPALRLQTREDLVDFSTNRIDYEAGFAPSENEAVVFVGNSTGLFPFGLKPNTVYYVKDYNNVTDDFQLSLTPGGDAIDLVPNTQGFLSTDNIYLERIDKTKIELKDVTNLFNSAVYTGLDFTSIVPSNRDIPANTFTIDWALSEWGGDSGWPKVSTALASRFVLSNTIADPTALWFSLRDNIYWWRKSRYDLDYNAREGIPDYGKYIEDGTAKAEPRSQDSYSYILTDELSREIRWLYPSKDLEFGTDVGEFTLEQFTSGAVVSPIAKYQSSYGAVYQNPLKVGNATIFILKDGKTLGRILFDYQREANSVTNLNVLAPNILNDFKSSYNNTFEYEAPLIKKIEWDHVKRILWVVTTTGDVFSVSTSFNVDQFGWQKQSFINKCEDILISSITVGKYTQDTPLFIFNNTLEHMVPRNEYNANILVNSNEIIDTEKSNIFNFHYLDSAETVEDFTYNTVVWTFTNPNFISKATASLESGTSKLLFTAENTGPDGNNISLVFDGIKTIATVLADWNTANPTNKAQVEYISGDGTAVLTAQTVQLNSDNRVHIMADNQYLGEKQLSAKASAYLESGTSKLLFTAVNDGTTGNSISLVFDGVKTIETVINDWNTANPTNKVTVEYKSGDGSAVLTAQTVQLKGAGYNLVFDNIVNNTTGKRFASITAGFTYKRRLRKTLVYSGSNTESGLEAYKRIDRVEVKFHRSSYAKIGSEDNNLRSIPFDIGDNPLALIDYNYVEAFSGNSEPEHTVIIESDLPLPVNVLTITTRGVLAE